MFEGRVPVLRARTGARVHDLGAGMSTIHGIHEVSSDLIDVFTESAIRHPHRPALVHHGRVLSYRRLQELANTLAGRLGDRPGVVAVAATRTPETVVGLLGVLASGGAYCPVDPAFPLERQQAMVKAAGCRTMLAADSGPATRLGLVPVGSGPFPELPANPAEMAPASNSRSHRAGPPSPPDTPRLPAPGGPPPPPRRPPRTDLTTTAPRRAPHRGR
ncbi:AMP-binding protein, partial [Kitasatospora indigofera]|uniref:AMP-binding protein n=1 Tax=Kitasatospora indigofera TaxID=67307 RepID=UPI00365AABC5